jgi:nucleotide-binding universal stress UspA family protein
MLPSIQTIFYATNLGPESPYVFRYALSLAKQYQASIHVYHILEPLSETAKGLVEFYLSDQEYKQRREKARQELMNKLKQRLSSFCNEEACKLEHQIPEAVSDVQVIEGRPAETILSTASKINADLIIMGTHRKLSEGRSKLLGSTARQVVNDSKIPVLTVYTPQDKLEEIQD